MELADSLNKNLTCAACGCNQRGGNGPITNTVVLEVILVLVFIFGSFLNTVLVAVFCRRRGFRSHMSNRFLINLVAANLLITFVLVPLILIDLIWPSIDSEYLPFYCYILRGMTTLTSSASILGQLLIGIDQYVAVVNPLHYHRNVNEFRCKLMCLSAWIVSICLVILTSIDQSIEYQFVANLVTLTLAYVIPIGAILVIYFRIFIAARSNSIKTRRNSSCSMTQEGVLSQNTQTIYNKYLDVSNYNLYRSPSMKSSTGSNILHLTSNLRASMRSKLSYASHLLLYGEEGRAAKVTILVLLSIAFCWLPYCVLTFFGLFHKSSSPLPLWTFDLALICGLCNTIFSPILYAYRSKRVQRDVKRTFGCKIFKVKKGCDTKANPRKLQRLKSLSCPQLLISSANENENVKTFNSLIASNTSFEKEPMICNKPKLSVFDVNQKLILQ